MTRVLKQYDLSILRSRHGTRWRIVDFAVGVSAFCVSFLLTPYRTAIEVPENIFTFGVLYGAILITSSRLCGVPVPGQRATRYEAITAIGLTVLITYVLFSVLVGLTMLQAYGRYIVAITTALSLFGMLIPRLILMNILRFQPINVVIYGAGGKGEMLARRLDNDPHFRMLGFLDNNEEYHGHERSGHPVLGSIQTFGKEDLKKIGTDIVVISIVAKKLIEENAHAILELPLAQIEVLNLGAFLEYHFKEVSVRYDCPQWFASSPSVPGNPSIFAAKRMLDILGAGVGMLLTLPLWPFIALAITLESRGPVLFHQTRVGKGHRLFTIYKFRTMVRDAEKNGACWAQKNDARVTRVGAVLRLLRLDELPQFWNVLNGDMSLVGPRPERPEFVEELSREIPYYDQRHLVPPGLTGWAQVRYRYGASKEDALNKLQYELYYIRHLSLMFDIEILMRTVPMMAKGSR